MLARKCCEMIGVTHCFQQLNTTSERCESNPLFELAQADRLPVTGLSTDYYESTATAIESSLSQLVTYIQKVG